MDLIENRTAFRRDLAAWYTVHQRPLPWRTEPSLYRTVVSELMAQQTQIRTMLPYFERWMQRFPDFETLAAAPSEAVLKHWEGLGYYSRARNLHKLAQTYIALDPKPRTREALQALPGIGPYTSAAISSIVFNEPAAVIDGNVVRLLARLSDDDRVFKNNGAAVKAFTSTAEEVLDPDRPGTHNQAMMELGATVCLKTKPLCTVCPVLAYCEARRAGTQSERPRIERKATEQLTIPRAWVRRDRRILLHRRPDDAGQLAGQYELPQLKQLGLAPPSKEPLLRASRSITHRRIKEPIYAVDPPAKVADDLEWVSFSELSQITLSGPHRRWLKQLVEIDK